MCKAKPAPRCYGHAAADLRKYHEQYPALAELSDAQVRAAISQAHAARHLSKVRILTREMDLRLDVDATAEGIERLKADVAASPGNADAWVRYQVALGTFSAKTDHASVPNPLHGREADARTLAERRERLARMEGRCAGTVALRGTLAAKDVTALVAEYDAVLECDVAARMVAARRRPDTQYATPADVRSWRAAVSGMNDGLTHLRSSADDFASRSHRAAAIATWGYAHEMPTHRYDGRRDFTGSPLDAVRLAVLTRRPIHWDTSQVRVEDDENVTRAKLWHAGYEIATPSGPILLRGTGMKAA